MIRSTVHMYKLHNQFLKIAGEDIIHAVVGITEITTAWNKHLTSPYALHCPYLALATPPIIHDCIHVMLVLYPVLCRTNLTYHMRCLKYKGQPVAATNLCNEIHQYLHKRSKTGLSNREHVSQGSVGFGISQPHNYTIAQCAENARVCNCKYLDLNHTMQTTDYAPCPNHTMQTTDYTPRDWGIVACIIHYTVV